jgi:hypothetical protein
MEVTHGPPAIEGRARVDVLLVCEAAQRMTLVVDGHHGSGN